MDSKKALTRIRRARTSLVLKHPFFASLAMRLQLKEDSSCQTAWSDGKVMGYNPEYINLLSSEKLEGMTAHVVMHPACNHHKRRNGRDHNMWNKACDYVINPILLDAGFTLPDGFLFRDEFSRRSAEAVYDIIVGEAEESEADATRAEDEESGSENSGETEETPDGEGAEEEGEAGGEQHQQQGDPGKSGEVRDDSDNSSSGDSDGHETDWDDAIIRAAIHARSIGDLPVEVERLVGEKLQPRLSWQELLSRFIQRAARSDYSWIEPNRRYIHQDEYFPSLKNFEIDEIAIAVDTSGSIGQQDMDQFAAEISDIIHLYPTKLYLLYCDLTVHFAQEYNQCDLPLTISAKGGGGTDYRPVFAHIEKRGIKPTCLIYLTDLECRGYPEQEPDFPVLWVKIGESELVPPFGETISLS